jgi:hypothetical protein
MVPVKRFFDRSSELQATRDAHTITARATGTRTATPIIQNNSAVTRAAVSYARPTSESRTGMSPVNRLLLRSRYCSHSMLLKSLTTVPSMKLLPRYSALHRQLMRVSARACSAHAGT